MTPTIKSYSSVTFTCSEQSKARYVGLDSSSPCRETMNPARSGKRNRRKQHGRAPSNPPRRKHKKEVVVNDIEEQLRVQRKKRALEEKSQRRDPQPTLGNYRYDPGRDAYFPADAFPRQDAKKKAVGGDDKKPKGRSYMQFASARQSFAAQAASSQSLRYATEISPSSSRQCYLRSLWAGRLLKMGMQVVPTVAPSRDGTRLLSMLPPLRTDSFIGPYATSTTPLDFVCKNRLHPSARTFDIHMGPDLTKLPSIATLVDGGSHLRFGHRPELWSVGDSPPRSDFHEALSLGIYPAPDSGEPEPHAIRFAPTLDQSPDDYTFATLCRTSVPEKTILRLWKGDDSMVTRADSILPFDVNDFAFHPHDASRGVIGLAPVYSKDRGSLPVIFDLVNEEVSALRVSPSSDALCVEYLLDFFLIGHRNGSLSIVDKRVRHANIHRAVDAGNLGSVTSITVMHGDNMFLTKHSFGSCFLWDVRNMGSESAGKVKAVQHLAVPAQIIHPTKSSCCNGVAVDPTHSFAVSPFVNTQERPCLAMWSLSTVSTGTFIGLKGLTSDATSENFGMPHCELSMTITPAWKPATCARDGDALEREKHAWGLWFKCGMSGPKTPSFVGSIHHVTFPGILDGDALHKVVQQR